MPDIGDLVQCTVTQAASWGAYTETESGEVVFINLSELSWERLRSASDSISLGDVITVFIMDEPCPNRPHYLGSLKRTVPDPLLSSEYSLGTVHEGVIIQSTESITFAQLSTNGRARLIRVITETPLDIGEKVQAKLTHVDVEGRKVEGVVI